MCFWSPSGGRQMSKKIKMASQDIYLVLSHQQTDQIKQKVTKHILFIFRNFPQKWIIGASQWQKQAHLEDILTSANALMRYSLFSWITSLTLSLNTGSIWKMFSASKNRVQPFKIWIFSKYFAWLFLNMQNIIYKEYIPIFFWKIMVQEKFIHLRDFLCSVFNMLECINIVSIFESWISLKVGFP